MITDKQIENLKPGDKLIFVINGMVLSTGVGNVFTFSNWYGRKAAKNDSWYNMYPKYLVDLDEGGKEYRTAWQCKELHDVGLEGHNFSIYHVELFDEKKHTTFVMMNNMIIYAQQSEFEKKYGPLRR